MKITENSIIPFENDKMEFQCVYDEKGHLIGQGKILDIYGDLMCEGNFISAPNEGKMSISYLKSGLFYFDGKSFEVSNFDGQNGYGAIIRSYTALVPCFDIKAGHFKDGKLNGYGVDVDLVAAFSKGEFEDGKLSKGSRSSMRGSESEIYEEYISYDYNNNIAKGKIEYRGKGEIIEGEFKFNSMSMTTKGILKSTTCDDQWEGEFRYNNGWIFINGKGKWDGFEGEMKDGKPINAQEIDS